MTDRECIVGLERLAEDIKQRYEAVMISRKLSRVEQREQILLIQGELRAVGYAIGRIHELDNLHGD